MKKEDIKHKFALFVKGFCMGSADVIPGVSGGTIAFILGIYADLINAIKSFNRDWLKSIVKLDLINIIQRPHFGFLLPLFAGIVSALLFFTRVVPLPELLQEFPEQIYGLFFGLISGSVIVLFREVVTLDRRTVLPLLAGIVTGLVVFNLVPMETPESAWFIFLSGILALCAMLLPGISGSFILLILNKYAFIFNAIGYFRFSVIVPFALGAITGLAMFSRILSWLLKKYHQQTLATIIGLLIASLWVIWPFQQRIYQTVRNKPRLMESIPYFPTELSQTVLFAVFMIIVGFAVVILLERLAIIRERAE